MRIHPAVVDAIVAHARRDHPNECCGLLLGKEGQVVEAVAVTNVADDPRRRYELSPVEHIAQIKKCRERSSSGSPAEVVGVYHSHPHTPAEPSPSDLREAWPNFLYVIAGPVAEGEDVSVRGFVLDGTTFSEAELIVLRVGADD
ncbi:MAG: M67 family metallopeptidase [Acidobacteria bacterium]|nr:M67 family metallopeptidase [Acidobacteriota bacterium]